MCFGSHMLTVNMFPSSSRIKLNREVLQDVGLKLLPRRRRVETSLHEVTSDSPKRERSGTVPGPVVVQDDAPSSHEPVQTSLRDPETVAGDTSEEPQESSPCTRKTKRRNTDDIRWKQKGPCAKDINTHLSPVGVAGSEGSLRKAVRSSGLCGDCKYASPQRKMLGKQGQRGSRKRREHPSFEVKIKSQNRGTKATLKRKRIDQYPKVILCDVSQICDDFHQGCSYMLPDDLKKNMVHCFKQKMRARFLVGCGCLGQNKHKRDEGALAKKSEFCPGVQSERSACKSRRLTRHLTHLKECENSQNLSSSASLLPNSWADKASSTLQDKCEKSGEYRTGVWDRDVREDLGPGSHLKGADIYADKTIMQGDCVYGDVLQATPDSELINCKSPAKSGVSRDGEKSCFWVPVYSHLYSKHAGGGNFGSPMPENSLYNTCDEMNSLTNTDAAASPLLCQGNEMDSDELESVTCQRVRVYLGKKIFSCARTYKSWPFYNNGATFATHPGVIACPVQPIDLEDNRNQTGISSDITNDMLSNAPADRSSNPAQVFPQNEKQVKDVESILAEGNKRSNDSVSPDNTNVFLPQLMVVKESPERPLSDVTNLSSPASYEGEPGTVSIPSFPISRSQYKSSTFAQFSSKVDLSNGEVATLSSMSSPFTPDNRTSFSITPSSPLLSSILLMTPKSVESAESSPLMVKAIEKTFYPEEVQRTSCTSSSSAPPHDSDSFHTFESSLHFSQDKQESDEKVCIIRCLQDVVQPCDRSPMNFPREKSLHNTFTDKCVELQLMLPPLLSPLTSPQRRSRTNFPLKRPVCSDVEEEKINKSAFKLNPYPKKCMHQTVDINKVNFEECIEHDIEELEEVSRNFKIPVSIRELQSHTMDEDVDEEECQDETDFEGDVVQVYQKIAQASSAHEIEVTSDVLAEPCSSLSIEADDEALIEKRRSCSARAKGLCSFEPMGTRSKAAAAGDTQKGILNELTAYEQDILLIDVIQDDSELFESVTQESLLKLGPTKVPKPGPIGQVLSMFPRLYEPSPAIEQRLTSVKIDVLCDIPDITEDGEDRPWRPHTSSKEQSTRPAKKSQTEKLDQPDSNNNHERMWPIKSVTCLPNHVCPPKTVRNGSWITSLANKSEFRHQKSNAYCRLYFSESLSCGFKMCRFQHVPMEGDEKFCVETVVRFTKNSMCLQKAGAVFAGYYHNNPPGVYFSMPMFLSLIWSLLKAGMISDVFSVLRVSLAHKIVPDYDFLLALFNYVREKGLMGLVPELMQLTFMMANSGLALSLDCLDCVKNTPEVQQTICPKSVSSKLSTITPVPEYLNLAHAVVEIELCSKQEDWRQMGEVFRSICQSNQRTNLMEQISGRIAIALLSESKDKLSLPFATFAETVCQDDEDSLARVFLGRIGVSLMLRYHKTHQWYKGQRVVEVLCISKVDYSTLKGLFGNEDNASRCFLITVATELFLFSGSLEGALNILRENKWFLSSASWPCNPDDLESRARLLTRLAEKTSHRDTLEVLCNLPGLQEPTDLVDVSRYGPLFNAHLQICVDRQTLPVASDSVDFMLSKKLAVDQAILKMLFHKLAKQNLWLRAREVFRHCLRTGYYKGMSAPPGFMTLIVPCGLGVVELALAIEMFITVNATVILPLSETTPCCPMITLKRTLSCEREYLSAGSRLLSAASIPQPKLIIHYKAVNSSQEQVFTLDVASARSWLRRNHLWANDMWPH